jgi:hypothetical protein
MAGWGVQHFDAEGLAKAVYDQPIGLRVVSNHPQGFRQLLYKHNRANPRLNVRILQAPNSKTAFLLVRPDYTFPEQEIEDGR